MGRHGLHFLIEIVMAGLVPAIHVLPGSEEKRRGCAAQGRA
jgi:hypothetical protein